MGKRLTELKEEWLQDPEMAAQYEAQAPEYALARELIGARNRAGLTQAQLAERMETTQSAIARLESGRQPPSWKTLQRFAEATGTRPEIRLIESA